MKTLLLKTFLALAIVAVGWSAASAQALQMGSVQIILLIKGGTLFTLATGGLVEKINPCYFGAGFCWDVNGFHLYKQGTQFDGSTGSISVVDTGFGCSQISFKISNGRLVLGGRPSSGLSAWYSQTSCSYPSGFMGGGSLVVYGP